MIRIIAERQQDFHTVARLLLVSPYHPSFLFASHNVAQRKRSQPRAKRACNIVRRERAYLLSAVHRAHRTSLHAAGGRV